MFPARKEVANKPVPIFVASSDPVAVREVKAVVSAIGEAVERSLACRYKPDGNGHYPIDDDVDVLGSQMVALLNLQIQALRKGAEIFEIPSDADFASGVDLIDTESDTLILRAREFISTVSRETEALREKAEAEVFSGQPR